MAEENISQKCRSKEIDKTRNYFIEKEQDELISKKHNKVCKILNYTEHLLILASILTSCVFQFRSCFFSCYSSSYSKFRNSNKNFHNNCRN